MRGVQHLRRGESHTHGGVPVLWVAVRRAVQRLIEDPLAERLLMGDFKAGDTIYVDAQNGEMVFTTELPSGELGADLGTELTDGDDDGTDPEAAKVPVSPEDQDRLSAMMGE